MRKWTYGVIFGLAVLVGFASTVQFAAEAEATECGNRCVNENPLCAMETCCVSNSGCGTGWVRKYTIMQEGPGCGNWCWTSNSCQPSCNPE